MEFFTTQLRQIFRRLSRARMFTAVTLLTLAVGIGANTAVFSVVECVLLKPLPYPHSEQLVAIKQTAPGWGVKESFPSAANYFVYHDQGRAFQEIGIYNKGLNATGFSVTVTGLGEPEHVPALGVTYGVLRSLDVSPFIGRTFTAADDSPGSPQTTLLTYGYWQRKFGGDRSVLGRTIDVDGSPRIIAGVLPQSFRFLDQTDIALLLPMQLDRAKTVLGGYNNGGIARLKPGVSLAQANADVARLLPIVTRTFPPPQGAGVKFFEDARFGPNLHPLKQELVGDVGRILWVLMGGIGIVLLIACANLANLFLVRVEGRQQELATRAALGASRGRVAAEIFLESLLLAISGGLLGLALAYGALRLLVAIAPPNLPRLPEIHVDGVAIFFTFALSIAASLLFGSAPAFKYAGPGLGSKLREGGRSNSQSRERNRSRNALVILQVALALVLLVGSGLMSRTFRALTKLDPGFVAPAQVQTFGVDIREAQEKNPERVARTYEAITRKIAAIPGVSSVSLSRDVPMDGSDWEDAVYAKDRNYTPSELPVRRFEFVAPGFFRTLGTPLLAGRDFTWTDTYNRAPIAIVSEKFAREYWHNAAGAIGKQIRETPNGGWREVVGVVGDIRQDGVDKDAPTSVYWPLLLSHFQGAPGDEVRRNIYFSVRSPRAGSQGLMHDIRTAVWSVNPDLALAEVHTLAYHYSKSMARISFTLIMLSIAAGMALLLGIVGLYGVVAYSVSQSRSAIGIRMAMGAAPAQVLGMVLRHVFKLALIGVVLGVAGALDLTRFLSGLLYGVKPSDPSTLIAVSLLLIAVSLVASYIPARQAARVDPMTALRHE